VGESSFFRFRPRGEAGGDVGFLIGKDERVAAASDGTDQWGDWRCYCTGLCFGGRVRGGPKAAYLVSADVGAFAQWLVVVGPAP
jgi:hypothetical protein